MLTYNFKNPTIINFGLHSIDHIKEIPHNKIMLLTTTGWVKRGNIVSFIEKELADRLLVTYSGVVSYPTPNDVDIVDMVVRKIEPHCLLALGGGSVIDTAKIIGTRKEIPVVAIPTTAGTGSEVTPFATMWDIENKKKISIDNGEMFPESTFIDPFLTLSLPKEETIYTGLDAISHAFESIWNINATPISIALATASLRLSLSTLPELTLNLDDIDYRKDMMLASLLAGLAISQTRTALAHAISYSLTINYDVPHGLACGFLLPEIFKFNSEKDDGRSNRLSNDLGHTCIADLFYKLKEIRFLLRIDKMIENFLPSTKRFSIDKETFLNGRILNNIRTVTYNDILNIMGSYVE